MIGNLKTLAAELHRSFNGGSFVDAYFCTVCAFLIDSVYAFFIDACRFHSWVHDIDTEM